MIPLHQASLAVGLDHLRPGRVRVVCLHPYDVLNFSCVACGCFSRLETFQRFWRRRVEPELVPCAGARLSVAARGDDDAGILRWLKDEKGLEPELHPLRHDRDLEMELLTMDLPRPYHRAYSLAQSALYRQHAPRIISYIWLQLLHLRQEAEPLMRHIERLALAQPTEINEPDYENIDVPF
jgi:hypothetical protein